jgi:elongation factor Ts
MAITPAMVKELRTKTGVGMMDCKNALVETDGNIEKAIEHLRKKGLSKAAKKSDRAATEGIVAALNQGTKGAIIEINSETDFVSKNDNFKDFVSTTAQLVLENAPADAQQLNSLAYPQSSKNVGEELIDRVATIGENLKIRRFAHMQVNKGTVASYVHMGGKIGVLVALETESDKTAEADEFKTLASDLAMHICAVEPQYNTRDEVPAQEVKKEQEILIAQMKADPKNAKKPDNILEKIVSGRIDKFYQEVCFLDQGFVKDPKVSINELVAQVGNTLGDKITVKGFKRFKLGEGLEKKSEDFAKEVAETFK